MLDWNESIAAKPSRTTAWSSTIRRMLSDMCLRHSARSQRREFPAPAPYEYRFVRRSGASAPSYLGLQTRHQETRSFRDRCPPLPARSHPVGTRDEHKYDPPQHAEPHWSEPLGRSATNWIRELRSASRVRLPAESRISLWTQPSSPCPFARSLRATCCRRARPSSAPKLSVGLDPGWSAQALALSQYARG